MVDLARMSLGDLRQKRDEVFPIEWQDFYNSAVTADAQTRDKVEYGFKVNALLLDALAKRVAAALGPDRFAVMLAPTRTEVGLQPSVAPDARQAVGDRVLADLTRLHITTIDGRGSVGPEDFWRGDGHWRPSGHRRIGLLLADFFAKRERFVGAAAPAQP